MDIKRAKQEIEHAVKAYLAVDDTGTPLIPPIRQRPILLMGPPGVGKTQIMEQIAQECGIALVAYTITHHTRQSAVGLPFIRHRNFGGADRSVTEYTMSEIIASVYDKMEQLCIRNTGSHHAAIFAVQNLWQPGCARRLGDCCRRQPAGVQQERAGF